MSVVAAADAALVPDLMGQLDGAERRLLGDLVVQLYAKRERHRLRASYYDMTNLLRDLGIAVPPNLRHLEVAMGWPAKAVDGLARRVKFTGFALPGGDVDSFGIPQMWADNRMAVEAPQAQTSALLHSVAFILTTKGDPSVGEPDVLMSVYDATSATGTWDANRRGMTSFLGIVDSDEHGATRMLFFTPARAHEIFRTENDRWRVRTLRHSLGRVPAEPLVYRPRPGRPFGSSRISRAVMSITDSAMRTVIRSEVGAEFYSAPQRYLLGAEEESFVGADGQRRSTWDLVMGRILAIARDEDGNVPELGQFPQISMQPHIEQMRMWAQLFAAETSLPVSSLGIVTDNPASAEAIYAAKEDIVIEAEATCDGFSPALVRSVITGVQIRDGLMAPPPELLRLFGRWRDPSTPSRAAATDAVMKQIQAGVLPPDSPVALEQLGYDDDAIQRITADRRRSAARQELAARLGRVSADAG